MAVKKVKDEKGTEYEIEVDDDDDDDGPFLDLDELKGIFTEWLDERESSGKSNDQPKQKKTIRLKSSQKKPPTQEQQKPRRLRLA